MIDEKFVFCRKINFYFEKKKNSCQNFRNCLWKGFGGCPDTQYDDTLHSNTQHNANQHADTLHNGNQYNSTQHDSAL